MDITLGILFNLKCYYIKSLIDKYTVPSLFLRMHVIKQYSWKAGLLKALWLYMQDV